MKIKALLIAATLLLAGSAKAQQFGFWESAPEHDLIDTRAEYMDGTVSTVSIGLGGGVMLSAFPADWAANDSHYEYRVWRDVVKVNGQAVQFKFERRTNGAILATATTYQGQEYVRGEFWNKSRVSFKWKNGTGGTFS
ncbi:MAG: hypothetical protein ACRCXB_23425, partial [Aeromonadaceae bacterium]